MTYTLAIKNRGEPTRFFKLTDGQAQSLFGVSFHIRENYPTANSRVNDGSITSPDGFRLYPDGRIEVPIF
jgi:hypothetical protein